MNNDTADERARISRRHQIIEQAKAVALDANNKETNFLLELVAIERDPERVWAAGDDDLTFGDFLKSNELCDDVDAYRAFAAGLSLIGGSPELALFIGHEAVVYVGEMASPDQVAMVVQVARSHRDQHGVVPDRATLRRAMGYA